MNSRAKAHGLENINHILLSGGGVHAAPNTPGMHRTRSLGAGAPRVAMAPVCWSHPTLHARPGLKGALCGGHEAGHHRGSSTSVQLSPSTDSPSLAPLHLCLLLCSVPSSAPLSIVLLSISPSSLSASLPILNFLSASLSPYQYRLLVWVCPSLLTSSSISLSLSLLFFPICLSLCPRHAPSPISVSHLTPVFPSYSLCPCQSHDQLWDMPGEAEDPTLGLLC